MVGATGVDRFHSGVISITLTAMSKSEISAARAQEPGAASELSRNFSAPERG